MFMTEQRCLVPELADHKFVWKLAFIVDLTSHIRFLNLKLQGETFLFCDLYWHVKALREKLSLIKNNLGSTNFASCKIFSTQIKVTLPKDYVLGIISNLVYVKNLRNVLKILTWNKKILSSFKIHSTLTLDKVPFELPNAIHQANRQ